MEPIQPQSSQNISGWSLLEHQSMETPVIAWQCPNTGLKLRLYTSQFPGVWIECYKYNYKKKKKKKIWK